MHNSSEVTVKIIRRIGGFFDMIIGDKVYTYSLNDLETTKNNLRKEFPRISDKDVNGIIEKARSQTSFDNEKLLSSPNQYAKNTNQAKIKKELAIAEND